MYDLTIEGVHTYYVTAGNEEVLVHNYSPVVDAEFQFPGGVVAARTSKTFFGPPNSVVKRRPPPHVRAGLGVVGDAEDVAFRVLHHRPLRAPLVLVSDLRCAGRHQACDVGIAII